PMISICSSQARTSPELQPLNRTTSNTIKNEFQNMKKVSLFALGLFVITACNSGNPTENTNEETAIGEETDEKGCLVAAGESWSELQQGCVQVFDIGTRLDPVVETDGEAIISAFVLYNEDQSKIEVFLPQTDHTIILDKVDAG